MKKFIISFLIFLFPAVCIFWPYLINNKFFVFVDVGQDFLLNIWPMYLQFTELLKQEFFPVYSLSLGFGTNVFLGSLIRTSLVDPFSWVLFLVPSQYFITAVPWVIVVKIIFSGLLFSYFLNKLSISYWSSILGGLLFAFSSQMLVRSGWYHYTTEMVFIPLFLLSIYTFFKDKKNIYLFFSFMWLGFYHSYYVIVYCIFGYLVFLHFYFTESKFKLKNYFKQSIRYFLVFFVGILTSAVAFIPTAYNILSSVRISESKSHFLSLGNLFVKKDLFLTIISRFFSSELIGFSGKFTGWENTLEAPILYFGLLSLILVSIAPFFLNKKEKCIFFMTSLLSVLYLFVPMVTQIINGSYGLRYKTSAFFITVAAILYTTITLDRVNQKNKFNSNKRLKIIFVSTVPLIMLSLLSYRIYFFEEIMNLQKIVVVNAFIFLFLYFSLISLKLFGLVKKHFSKVVLVFLIIELVVFGKFTIQERTSLSKSDISVINSQTTAVSEIVERIKEFDTSFYRIEKNFGIYGPGYPNDSAAVDYKGTGIYHSFNHKSFSFFTSSLGILDDSFAYRFFSGFSEEEIALRRLLGVKYYITETADIEKLGYEKIFHQGSTTVWKDPYALEFGTVFTTYTKYSNLDSYSDEEKKELLLTTIALSDDDINLEVSKISYCSTCLELNTSQKKTYAFLTEIQNTKIKGTVTALEPGIMFIPILFDEGWKITANGLPQKILSVNYGFMGVYLDKGTYEFELKYVQPYFKTGIIISSLTAMVIFSVFYLQQLLKKRRKGKKLN